MDPEDPIDLSDLVEMTQPLLRLYLQTQGRPDVSMIAQQLTGCESVSSPWSSPDDPYRLTLMQTRDFASENEFRAECLRVASILDGILQHSATLECILDRVEKCDVFHLRLHRTDGGAFSETAAE